MPPPFFHEMADVSTLEMGAIPSPSRVASFEDAIIATILSTLANYEPQEICVQFGDI